MPAEFTVHVIQPAEVVLREIISRFDSRQSVNAELEKLTGIEGFFSDEEALGKARRFSALSGAASATRTIREWGDFQTPPHLATQVCRFLQAQQITPQVVVEPTYGLGNFLDAALVAFPDARLFYGVEIQSCYEWHFKMARFEAALRGETHHARLQLHHDSIFTHQFSTEVLQADDILILGNPPWVTSAELGFLDSQNLPRKRNLKDLNGLDALTGKSNFDLNESILLRLLDLFALQSGTLALLCKNSVIKNWLERLPKLSHRVRDVQQLEIDAKKEFGAAVSASLLFARFGEAKTSFSCRVASLEDPRTTQRSFGWQNDLFVSDIGKYRKWATLDGKSPFVWRQGLKHDCAAVMELTRCGDNFSNALGEEFSPETPWIFPLFKSSDLRAPTTSSPRKWVVVPQKRLSDDTAALSEIAPRLWDYLSRHKNFLDARKSSIYRGKAPFSIFGIGDYSFKPFKVAISGLYKTPRFCCVEPVGGQPAMLDDTCYFLGFDDRDSALLVTFLLNSPPALEFLDSIAFSDAKRPFTKDILMRLDLNAIFQTQTAENFAAFWKEYGFCVEKSIFASSLLKPSAVSSQLTMLA